MNNQAPTLHWCHCGGVCMFRLHTEDGVLRRITSEGDIPAAGSFAADESLFPEQRRACVKGFCELERNRSPDRVLRPMVQMGARGDASAFSPVSWESALDEAAAYYGNMLEEQKRLGYLPVWDKGGVTPWLGSYIGRYGSASLGNLVAAMQGAVGRWGDVPMPHIADIARTKLLIIWSSDPTTTRPHWAFRLMKAKEAGVPVVVVDSRLSDAAAALATGYRTSPAAGAAAVDVPPFLCVRPGGDAAMLAAMCLVIVEKNLHDETFLRESCFGFYPGDAVRSRSPASNPVTGEAYADRDYAVPPGESFLEYLADLKRRRGGVSGVLRWASELTGASAADIEALAVAYATTKPAFLLSSYHGGAQRQENGMYFSWLLIALAAVTGNIGLTGGGFGDIGQSGVAPLNITDPPSLDTPARQYPAIDTCVSQLNRVILEGTDGRTPRQLREDVRAATGIDLGRDARLEVKMLLRGASSGDPFNQFPGINRRLAAWEKLDHVVSYERYLSATARYSDIVLPSCSHLEERFLTTYTTGDVFAVGGMVAPPEEARPDWWIQEQLAARLGIPFTPRSRDPMAVMEKQWEQAQGGGKAELSALLEKGILHAPPAEYTPPEPGRYPTETGRVNFYSPFLAERGRATHGVETPRYVRPSQGVDDVAEHGGLAGRKGILYPLQLLTPHVKQRAHSSFDNVTTLRELFPHAVTLHPADADARKIHDGDTVYVFNDAGCLRLPAKLSTGILPGTAAVGQGTWYRPCPHETYTAWYDDGTGYAPHVTAVDMGGNPNTITPDIACGALDPFYNGAGIAVNGILCEVSTTNPG